MNYLYCSSRSPCSHRAPTTRTVHVTINVQRYLSPQVLRRRWYRFSPVYSPGSLPSPPPPPLFFSPSLSLSLSLFLSFSLWSQLLVKRFRFHGFGTRWNCPFLVYRPIRASFSRRFEGNFDSDTNLLVEQSSRLLFLWKLRKIFGEKFWSVGEKVESLLLLLLLLLFIKLFFLSFIAFIRYFVDIWKNNIMILYHVILTFGNGNFQWKIEVLRYLKYLWNKLFE